jgi:hypothetical protein
MCASWNKEYNRELLVQGLEKIRVTDPAGRYAGFEAWLYDDFITVMYTSLSFSPEITETDKRNIIHISVRTVAERGKLSSKSLLGELSRQERAYLAKPEKKLILATSLSVRYFTGLKRSSILKLPIIISARLPKHFNQQKALERPGYKYHFNLPVDYAAARIFVQARSNFEAAEKALNALDLLRGIWNLYLNHSGATRHSFGRIQPVNHVLRGPISTLHERTGQPITEVFWFDSDYVEPLPAFDLHRRWGELHTFEEGIRRYLRKNPYRQAVEDALRRYSSALDTRDHNVAFLSLWGLLETLTNTEKVSSDITVKRASALWDQPDFNKHVLKQLKAYRNRAVHAGHRTDEIETYLHQLRRYVEGLLSFHIYNVQKFASIQEAAEFLDLPSDLTVLQKRMSLLKKAIKFHKGS